MIYKVHVCFGLICYMAGCIFSFTDIEAGHRMVQLATASFVMALLIKGKDDE